MAIMVWISLFGVLSIGCRSLAFENETGLFEWQKADWSPCSYKDYTIDTCCGACYKKREVFCVYIQSGEKVAPFHCHRLGLSKPTHRAKCPRSECAHNCVLSLWEKWSPCSHNCGRGTRYRIRKLLVPSNDKGSECEPLVETEVCAALPPCLGNTGPIYRWNIGPWTSCRKKTDSDDCALGVRQRAISCVNPENRPVPIHYCRHMLKDEAPPTDTEVCLLPCDCEVSHWSEWSHCQRTCNHGNTEDKGLQERMRRITKEPKHGGMSCPHLRETRECERGTVPHCPRYVWRTGAWTQCQIPPGETEICGAGFQSRTVTCVKEGDPRGTPVDKSKCGKGLAHMDGEPVRKRACLVPCPRDCQLGEWENWSSCTKSCGPGGQRIRRKIQLEEAAHGGRDCDVQFETKPCENVPCSWWHKGAWASCFLSKDARGGCGTGVRYRSVYCLTSLNQVVSDQRCQRSDKPALKGSCHVPCKQDCTVSEWSPWTPCSRSCGMQGGTQQRTRKITSRRSSGAPCLSDEELHETRVCNKGICKTHMWQVSAWTKCVKRNNSTKTCGNGTGFQTRKVLCERDPGFPSDDRNCDQAVKPPTSRICDAPCPVDCELTEWTDWSRCSQTCGPDAYKFRYKKVVNWPQHGGKKCPNNTDKNGVLMTQKRCRRAPPCPVFKWSGTPWGDCVIKYNSCGYGVRSRNVSCVKVTGDKMKILKNDACYEKKVGNPLPSKEHCFKPCDGDCTLSEWSLFGECSQSCGDKPGTRRRTRTIVNLDLSIPLDIQCIHINMSDLTDTQPCGNTPCPTYKWDVGQWSSCIAHNSKDPYLCGEGTQRRHVMCQRSDGVYVSDEFCDKLSLMPFRHQKCTITCPRDCEVTDWSPWSPCSEICGMGLKRRQRLVLTEPLAGGRDCPQLEMSMPCINKECSRYRWAVDEWSECIPNHELICGPGLMVRNVYCPAGHELEGECLKRNPKPAERTGCDVPCALDCRMSSWTDFSPCQCIGGKTGFKKRTRKILQEPLNSRGFACKNTEETQACPCHTYQKVEGNWSSCIIQGDQGCGKGLMFKPINCRRSDGVLVELEYCSVENATETRACEIKCPVDCQVDEFNHWSSCSSICGPKAHKYRSRSIKSIGNKYGRKCPTSDLNKQNTTCPSQPCYKYVWHKGPWGECSMARSGCGVGVQQRKVMCIRSDGKVMEDRHCLTDEEKAMMPWSKLTLVDRDLLDLATMKPCGIPCPGDCVVSEWSSFGPCFTNCTAPRESGFRVRARVVLQEATIGSRCPHQMVQIIHCSPDKQICPVFMWKASDWNSHGRRKVGCVGKDGSQASSGCTLDERPRAYRACRDPCSLDASCQNGKCVCNTGFSGDGLTCLPDHGCERDSHCLFNNTVCDIDTHTCVCRGTRDIPTRGAFCPGDDTALPLSASNVQLLFILLGCLCGLLIISLLVTLLLFRWKRRKSMKVPKEKQGIPKLTVIHAYDSLDKNASAAPPPRNISNGRRSRMSSGSSSPLNPAPMPSWGEYDSLRKNSQSPSVVPYSQGKMIEFHDDEVFGKTNSNLSVPTRSSTYDDQDYIPMFSPDEGGSRHSGIDQIEPLPEGIRGRSVSRSERPRMSTFKPDSMQDISKSETKDGNAAGSTGAGSAASSDSGRDSEDSLTRFIKGQPPKIMYENLPPPPKGRPLPPVIDYCRQHDRSSGASSPSDSGLVMPEDEGQRSGMDSPATQHRIKNQQLMEYCDDLVAELEGYGM